MTAVRRRTRGVPYALQRLCHACPVLSPARALPARIPLGLGPSLHRLRRRSLRSVRRLQSYYGLVRRPAPVHHRLRLLAFPMRTGQPASRGRPDAGPPRFRRDPSRRDVVFDSGRASAPRIAGPHMLPSTLLTVSASASFLISELNRTPRRFRCVRFVALVASGSRNTRCRAARYDLTRAGLPPADRASLLAPSSNPGPHPRQWLIRTSSRRAPAPFGRAADKRCSDRP